MIIIEVCSCCTGGLQALQRVPLFAGLDPKTKGAIATALGQVSMPKGTAVVTQVRGSVQTGGERERMQVQPLTLQMAVFSGAFGTAQCRAIRHMSQALLTGRVVVM